jgi:hypothetical protein
MDINSVWALYRRPGTAGEKEAARQACPYPILVLALDTQMDSERNIHGPGPSGRHGWNLGRPDEGERNPDFQTVLAVGAVAEVRSLAAPTRTEWS